MTAYIPKPIDCAAIALSDAQAALVEQLARNTHEVWAEKRMSEGWRHGPSRNDDGKLHPCLVPFEALPDAEKDYDRVIVEQVVKAALALGYRIDKP